MENVEENEKFLKIKKMWNPKLWNFWNGISQN
jgi:hypothetical protein